MTTLLERYMSFDGRLARLPYFIRGIYVGIAFIIVFFLSISAFTLDNRAAWWAGLALIVAAVAVIGVGTVSLIVRRLHDLGMSGYHAIWIGVAELGWYFLADAPGETQLLALPLFAILVWLQFYPGHPADNRYGSA
jgi:uncharacterized membrane protein YhaH (DUF805 family)